MGSKTIVFAPGCNSQANRLCVGGNIGHIVEYNTFEDENGSLLHALPNTDENILIGDLVYVFENELIPANILVLDSSQKLPCMVQTESGQYREIRSLFDNNAASAHVERLSAHKPLIGKVFMIEGELCKNGRVELVGRKKKIIFSQSHVAYQRERLITRWLIGVVIHIDRIVRLWEPIQYNPRAMTNQQLQNVSTKGILVAMLSTRVFRSKDDWIIDGECNGKFICMVPRSRLNLVSAKIDFTKEQRRCFLLGFILSFPFRRYNLVERALYNHGIGLQVLAKGSCVFPHLRFTCQIVVFFDDRRVTHIKYMKGSHCKILYEYIVQKKDKAMGKPNVHQIREKSWDKERMLVFHSSVVDETISFNWKQSYPTRAINQTRAGTGFVRRSFFHFDSFPFSHPFKIIIHGGHLSSRDIEQMEVAFNKKALMYNENTSIKKWLHVDDSVLVLDRGNHDNFVTVIQYTLGANAVMSVDTQSNTSSFSKSALQLLIRSTQKLDSEYNLDNLEQLKYLKYEAGLQQYVMDISHLGLRSFPEYCLDSLKTGAYKALDFSRNRMHFLPAELGNIKNLTKVFYEGNPFNSIPKFQLESWKKLKTYLRSINAAAACWNRSRIIIVGQEAVGKTTIVQNLKKKIFQVSSSSEKFKNLSTNGIEIHSGLSASGNNENSQFPFQLDVWDFGGQEIFYPTHQFFLSEKAIYLVVFRCDDVQSSRLEYWLKTIRWLTNNTHNCLIFLVGTHCDLVTKESLENIRQFLNTRYTKQFYHALQPGVFFINRDGDNIPQLYQCVMKTIHETNFLPLQVPPAWIHFQNYLDKVLDKQLEFVTWAEFRKMAIQNGVHASEVRNAALFLAKYVGQIVFLGESGVNALNQLVVLQPQWLANVLSSVITFQHQFIKKGVLQVSALQQILKPFAMASHSFIIECLKKFKVLVFLKQQQHYLAPSLLPEEPETYKLEDPGIWGYRKGEKEHGKNYKFYFLPIGYMAQIIGRVLLLPSVQLLYTWRNGIVFRFNEQERVYLHLDPLGFRLKLRVRVNCSILQSKFSALSQVSYILDSTLSILYNAKDETQVQCTIPCPHCLTLLSQHGGTCGPLEVDPRTSFEEDIHEFTLFECISRAGAGKTTLQCPLETKAEIQLSWAAPDVVFSSVNVIDKDDLELCSILGKGGFGSVYKAKLRRTGHWANVAIKELSFSDASKSSDSEKTSKFSEFLAEVSFMKQLSHKCIVQLYGIRLNPKPGIVMEFLLHGNLHNFLGAADESLSWDFRINVALDIAKAMEYMNKTQLVHRDLRTENILLASLDANDPVRAKLADFGLSRQLLDSSIEFGHDIWQYNPPERLKENKYSIESDVYSFAICCWEIASRQIPYGEWEDSDTYYKTFGDGHKEINLFKIKEEIINGLRPSLALIDNECPNGFLNLITCCWVANPDNRPSFAGIVEQLSSVSTLQLK